MEVWSARKRDPYTPWRTSFIKNAVDGAMQTSKEREMDAKAISEIPKTTITTVLPNDAAARKRIPIGTGVLDYFPDALAAVAEVSRIGNDQHNPGQPLHWARGKSSDEADTLIRHFLERGTRDTDGARHSAKMVWRALAVLQKEIEAERGDGYVSRGSRK
jgi:hypothetical protein